MTAALRELFDRWVASDNRPLVVPVRRMADETVTFEEIVRGLHDDHTALPDETAGELQLPFGATYAEAAFMLWWAREADTGPGVRSYRAAAFLLADLDEEVRDRLLEVGDHEPQASSATG